jgi:putative ABC transport system permease protein
MRFFDLFSLIFYNLSRRKGRVALTAIGVVIGTASVVILVALASGLQRNATQQYAGIGDLNIITVMPKFDQGGPIPVEKIGGGGGSSGQPTTTKLLTNLAIEEISALEGIANVIPRDSMRYPGRIKMGKLENYPWVFSVGVPDTSVLGYELESGTSKLDRGTAIIGAGAARS